MAAWINGTNSVHASMTASLERLEKIQYRVRRLLGA